MKTTITSIISFILIFNINHGIIASVNVTNKEQLQLVGHYINSLLRYINRLSHILILLYIYIYLYYLYYLYYVVTFYKYYYVRNFVYIFLGKNVIIL